MTTRLYRAAERALTAWEALPTPESVTTQALIEYGEAWLREPHTEEERVAGQKRLVALRSQIALLWYQEGVAGSEQAEAKRRWRDAESRFLVAERAYLQEVAP